MCLNQYASKNNLVVFWGGETKTLYCSQEIKKRNLFCSGVDKGDKYILFCNVCQSLWEILPQFSFGLVSETCLVLTGNPPIISLLVFFFFFPSYDNATKVSGHDEQRLQSKQTAPRLAQSYSDNLF